jgi:hypothetical protein
MEKLVPPPSDRTVIYICTIKQKLPEQNSVSFCFNLDSCQDIISNQVLQIKLQTAVMRIRSAQERQYSGQPASQRMFFGMKTDELDSPPQYLLVSAAFEQLPGFG